MEESEWAKAFVASHPPLPGFECHIPGCPREREGYSWWCIRHKDRDLCRPSMRCPCHGALPPGFSYRTEPTEPAVPVPRRVGTTRRAINLADVLVLLRREREPMGGEEIAVALGVRWSMVRSVLNQAVHTGRLEVYQGAYSLSMVGRRLAMRL